jgi:hypothetical protein
MKGILQRRPEASSATGVLATEGGVPWRELRPRLALFAGLAILTIVLFPSRSVGPVPDVRAGMIAPEDVIAPFDYRIPKTAQELEHDRALAAISVPRMYRPAAPADSIFKPVGEYLAKVARIAEAAVQPGAAAPPAARPRGAGAEPAGQNGGLTSEIDS